MIQTNKHTDTNIKMGKCWAQAVVIFCVVFLCGFSLYMESLQNSIRRETETYLAECGEQGAQNIRDSLTMLLDSAVTIAGFLGKSDLPLSDPRLMSLLPRRNYSISFSQFGIAAASGLMRYNSGLAAEVRGQPFFEMAMLGKANISPLKAASMTGGQDLMLFSAPIRRNGRIIGVLSAFIYASEFSNILNITLFNGHASSYVVDSNGVAVMSSGVGSGPSGEILNAAIRGAKQLRVLLSAGENGVVKVSFGGQVSYVGCTRIGINQWQLLSMVPEDAVNPRFAGLSRSTIFGGAILFIFLLFIAVTVSRRFAFKNKMLSETMKDLQTSEERYKIVTENSDEHIFEWNLNSDYIYYSPSYERRFGRIETNDQSEQAIIKSDKIYPDDKVKLSALANEFKNGLASGKLEIRLRTPQGAYRWCSLKAVSISSGSSRRVVGVLKDIDAEYRERQHLLRQSQTDKLTGLLDKLTTQNEIESYLGGEGKNGRHMLLIIDADNFKILNDTYGHYFGDTALKNIAERIRSAFRTSDVAGRIGGDEFMVLIKDVPSEEFVKNKMHSLAEALRHCLDDTEHKLSITASVGLAAYPADASDFSGLYKAADHALYEAKNAGKNSFAIYRGSGRAEIVNYGKPVHSLSLLITEGAAASRAQLRETLAAEYNVIESEDRQSAVKLICGGRGIGAVIIDCSGQSEELPYAAQQIAAAAASVNIPAVAAVSGDDQEAAARLKQHGLDILTVSPFDANTVRSQVRNIIAGSLLRHMEKEKQLAMDLSSTNVRLQSLIDTVPCGIAMLKLLNDGCIEQLFFSDAFCQLSGSTREYVMSSDLLSFIYPQDLHIIEDMVRSVLAGNTVNVHGVFRIINQEKKLRWLNMTGEQFSRDEDGRMFSLVFLDTTAEIEQQLEKDRESRILLYKSKHDPLTDVYNRAAFFAETEAMLAAAGGERYVMVCQDVDRFKVINDLFGAETGDEVLCEIAASLKAIPHKPLTCGRLGGDVFAFCFPLSQFSKEVLEREARHKFSALGDRYEVLVRFGVCIIEDPSTPANVICDRAMLALRTIKGSYSQRVAFYSNKIRNTLIREQEIVSDMEDSLVNENFKVWFQPICDLTTGRPAAAEALVRWAHPEKGLLMPGDFVPLFEQNGFISRLDAFVWEKTCQRLAQLASGGGEPLPLSVNISRLDFHAFDVCAKLSELTQKYSVPSSCLHLEITESTYAEDPQKISAAIHELHKKGFVLLVDDFGSGWSTLRTIRDAPMDILKIDKQITDDLESSSRSRIITDSIIQMARMIGMPVIAEGVESDGQAEILRKMQCDQAQGYFYAKPLPWDEFTAFISQGR